jgi:CheY-like chemotaxis protein
MVIITVVAFVVVDLIIRFVLRRVTAARVRKEREEALETGLRLAFSEETPSLKRVTVEVPKARILAVDDEAIILDSFRKILVLEGFAVDTVETGPEALNLVRSGDYDFVFTDLKMPDMDGVEVVKGVKHLRPDVDVVVITGFATIETAVETMKHGAMDYVQKPFTAEELAQFANKALIRRQDRIERALRPHVHLVTPTAGSSASPHEFNVPSGLFVSEDHVWVGLFANGLLQAGVDDFAQKIFGPVQDLELPAPGTSVARGEPLVALVRNGHRIHLPAPVSGRVVAVNEELDHRPEMVNLRPYEAGWVCWIEPSDLPAELPKLRIGANATAWYEDEIERYEALRKGGDAAAATESKTEEEATWDAIQRTLVRA